MLTLYHLKTRTADVFAAFGAVCRGVLALIVIKVGWFAPPVGMNRSNTSFPAITLGPVWLMDSKK